MQNLHQAVPQSQPANQKLAQLPYDALDSRCPRCRACIGRACKSTHRKVLRYPHPERIECAASEYRAEIRLELLQRIRRHPFALAFSPRRMVVEGFDRVSSMKGKAEKNASGDAVNFSAGKRGSYGAQ